MFCVFYEFYLKKIILVVLDYEYYFEVLLENAQFGFDEAGLL